MPDRPVMLTINSVEASPIFFLYYVLPLVVIITIWIRFLCYHGRPSQQRFWSCTQTKCKGKYVNLERIILWSSYSHTETIVCWNNHVGLQEFKGHTPANGDELANAFSVWPVSTTSVHVEPATSGVVRKLGFGLFTVKHILCKKTILELPTQPELSWPLTHHHCSLLCDHCHSFH